MISGALRLPGCSLALLLGIALALAPAAEAQLRAEREYCGVNRRIPVSIERPEGMRGDLEIALLRPGTAEETQRRAVRAGEADLGAVFPTLWAAESPTLLYAQLLVGGEKAGAALVLSPMMTPKPAENITIRRAIREAARAGKLDQLDQLLDRESNIRQGLGNVAEFFFPTPAPYTFSGYRVYQDAQVVIETSLGNVVMRMRPDEAPIAAATFMDLVDGGFYTDIRVDRVLVGPPPFVIQLGDPTGTRYGNPGFFVDLEQSGLPHDFGVVSLARRPSHADTGGSQIFICLSREGTRDLDGRFASFAEVVAGAETLLAIESAEVGGEFGDEPVEPIIIRRMYLRPAPPYGEGPEPVTRPEPSPDER